MQVELIAERAGRNQDTFRKANEEIERQAVELVPEASETPFICECPDPTCREIVLMSFESYEGVRSRGEWFLAAPGHAVCEIDGVPIATIVKEYATYTLMEKIGDARQVARKLDPRS